MIISAQENLDIREENKGVCIKSLAFVQHSLLMELQNSSKSKNLLSAGGGRRRWKEVGGH